MAYAIQTLMGQYVDVSARDKVLAKSWVGGKLRKKTATDTQPK